MNICGCLVHASPDHIERVAESITAMDGCEIHGQSEDGRFVVVVEDTDDRKASEIIMEMHQVPGVVSLTLTYHHFEELGGTPRPEFDREFSAGDQAHDHI